MKSFALGVLCVAAMACNGRGVSVPTAPSSLEPHAASSAPAPDVTRRSAPSGFGVGAADLAICLGGSSDPACFAAARLRPTNASVADAVAVAPRNLTASTSINSVTLAWSAPGVGDPVLSYVIEAGSQPGGVNLAKIATNTTATTFFASGVPPGTYFVRVRSQTASGMSDPSNEVLILVLFSGCTSVPNPPTGLMGTVSAGIVTLRWSAPMTGICPPSSFILEAGAGPGLSNVASFNTGNPATTYVAAGVPPRTYYVRVSAANANGRSAPSNESIVTVP